MTCKVETILIFLHIGHSGTNCLLILWKNYTWIKKLNWMIKFETCMCNIAIINALNFIYYLENLTFKLSNVSYSPCNCKKILSLWFDCV